MLDAKLIESDQEKVKVALERRNFPSSDLKRVLELSTDRKVKIAKADELKSKRNQVSKEIAELKKKSKTDKNATIEAEDKVKAMRSIGDEIKNLDQELKLTEDKLNEILLTIPNLPHESVPNGKDECDNQEIRKWGDPKVFPFKAKDHVQIGESLGILDFERAAKLSGARFSVYRGAGATLERALIQLMLDLHIKEHGYEEIIPPFLVNRETMTGTGQLPKFEDDLFRTDSADREFFLIPTAEVPLTNLLANEVLLEETLPRYFTAYTPCFRSEAGSHGKDVRGLFRQHQFQKIELVKISNPENSYEELEKMTNNAEKVLQLLGLPYRVMLLCAGDMGFSATKTYDIEVWLPGQGKYREISSCSNCEDFQARRAKIRFKEKETKKNKLTHTLNGSGLAVGRTFIALLETYQDKDGNVQIPTPLHRYCEGAPGFTKKGSDLWMLKP